MTIKDLHNKKVAEKLLDLICGDYGVSKDDILKAGKKKGSGYRAFTEPKWIFFYLLKKHSSMSYKETSNKLDTVHLPNTITDMVTRAEAEKKADRSFYHQIKATEAKLLEYLKSEPSEPIN